MNHCDPGKTQGFKVIIYYIAKNFWKQKDMNIAYYSWLKEMGTMSFAFQFSSPSPATENI